jgi:hypothetical protein
MLFRRELMFYPVGGDWTTHGDSMKSRLDLYIEEGVLPSYPELTFEQRQAIVHAAPDEASAAIAERIGAGFFAVQRYRAITAGLLSSKLHWRTCTVCEQTFATRYPARRMHERCERARRSMLPPRCAVYFPVCPVCGKRFCAQTNRTMMHEHCRQLIDARLDRRLAA